MPCYSDGNGLIYCSRKNIHPKRCYKCNRIATLLCDGGDSALTTCDKPMCENCAKEIGKDNHVCEEHYNEFNIRQAKSNREQITNVHKSLYGVSDIVDYTCLRCKNEIHSINANFCKICGLKIEKGG